MDLLFLDELKHKLGFESMKKPAMIGIVGILVIVLLFAGRTVFTGTASSSQFEVRRADEAPAQESSTEDASEPRSIFIHVSGAVANPGLIEVSEGDRVDVAIQAAGGFTADAAQDGINLARSLEDGEQLKVPTVEELAGNASASNAASSGTDIESSAGNAAGLVNINTASKDELVSLPGIGDSTAAKIISDRQANGSFKSKEDLKRVSGIGDKKYEALSDLICV